MECTAALFYDRLLVISFFCIALRKVNIKAHYNVAHMSAMRRMPLTLITLSFHACVCTMHAQCWYHAVVTTISLFCTWLHGAEDALLSSDARGCTVHAVIACRVVHVLALTQVVGSLPGWVRWDRGQDQ